MPSGTLPPSIESELRLSGRPHSRLRLLNRLFKEINQLIHNTLRHIDRGNYERIWIYAAPVKIVSKAANLLRKIDTLRSAVAFPKWMRHIDCVIKVRNLLRQLTMGQALTAETGQTLETRIGTRFDLCGRNKSGSLLGDIDCAYLSSPAMTVFANPCSDTRHQDNNTAFPAMVEWATATNKAIAPMEFPDALHYLMKDQKMTVEHLEETSLISTRTIIRLSNDPDYGVTREHIVALSVGLTLPPIISMELLRKAGLVMKNTMRHNTYCMPLASTPRLTRWLISPFKVIWNCFSKVL